MIAITGDKNLYIHSRLRNFKDEVRAILESGQVKTYKLTEEELKKYN